MHVWKDPRKPRVNKELKQIEKLMAEKWRYFKAAESYKEKTGNLMLLQAHLEEWLNQPEFIYDLEEGAINEKTLTRQLLKIEKFGIFHFVIYTLIVLWARSHGVQKK